MATGRLRAQPGHINHLCGSAYLPCGLPRCPRLPATSYNKWRFVSPGSRCEEGVGELKSDSVWIQVQMLFGLDTLAFLDLGFSSVEIIAPTSLTNKVGFKIQEKSWLLGGACL